jgi:hypothetical protein
LGEGEAAWVIGRIPFSVENGDNIEENAEEKCFRECR